MSRRIVLGQHIRGEGPGCHQWRSRTGDHRHDRQECRLCGARRILALDPKTPLSADMRAWIAGAGQVQP